MESSIINLSAWDLMIAGGLVLCAGSISLALRLGLERRLAWAAVRTVVQLFLIGYVLKWVFAFERFWAVAPVVAFMIIMASQAALGRASRRYPQALWDTLLVLAATATLVTFVVTAAVVQVQPWYAPRYFIPLLGMILGNGLTGISLCIDLLLEQFQEQQARVEMELAMGATRWEAARDLVREAVRRGMIPVINSMMVVGIVSLPGMMTGQILAGNPPMQAVKYQVVVMFMIAASTSLGCMGTALLAYRRLFNDRHQLEASRIRRLAK